MYEILLLLIFNEIFYSTKSHSFIVVISPKYGIQECIPVGCVPSASMVIFWGGLSLDLGGICLWIWEVSVSGSGRCLSLGLVGVCLWI